MYNQEIKERFLSEFTSDNRNSQTCISYIESIGVYEGEVCLDLAQMSMMDACRAVQHIDISTYGSAFAVISFVRNYIKWCLDNNAFDSINSGLLQMDVNDIDISDNLSRLLFISEQDFIDALKTVRPFDDGYYDVIVMAFAWLGVPQDKAVNLEIGDVDLLNMTARISDTQTISISENIGDILITYNKTKTGSRILKQGVRTVYRDDSYGKFVRKFSAPKQLGKPLTKSQIQSAVYELNNAYVELGNPPRFTNSNILRSGALRRVYDLECSGVDVFSIKNKGLVLDTFVVKAKLHEILWLYKNYKRAFNL